MRRDILKLVSLFLFVLLTSPVFSAPLDDEIERQLMNRSSTASAHTGVYAVNLDTGKVIADVQGEKLFIPASTRKLVSTALAARAFEGSEKIITPISYSGNASASGRVTGDLIIHAQGDPSWRSTFRRGRSGDSVFESVATQIRQQGISSFSGDLIVDTSDFDKPDLLPIGWDWDDLLTRDGAKPSALSIDRSLVGIQLSPASIGQPVNVRVLSPVTPFEIINTSETVSSGRVPTLTFERGMAGKQIMISGNLPAGSDTSGRSVVLGEPTLYAALVMKEVLQENGITIDGNVRLSDSVPRGEVVAIIESASYFELLAEANHESDNHVAEILYLLAGKKQFGQASYNASQRTEEQFWKSLGVASSQVEPIDGSGLSRRNLITPKALATLLEEMADNQSFTESLSVAGVSGTLRYRLSEEKLQNRVRGKTGTLTGIGALAGYADTNSGDIVAFAIMVNNHTSSSGEIRNRIDKIVETLSR